MGHLSKLGVCAVTAALLLLLTPADALAYLTYKGPSADAALGYPIDRVGTRYRAGNGPVPVKINLLRGVGYQGNGRYARWERLTDAQKKRLLDEVTRAAGYWSQLPDAAIRLSVVGSEQSTSPLARRSYILVTLGDLPRGVGGVAYNHTTGNQLLPLGLMIASLDSGVIAHELGHQLGLHHSSCTATLTRNATFGGWTSHGAIMSYAHTRGLNLRPDDMAAVASLYPNASYGTTTGEIAGHLVDGSGRSIFGANVFAVDRSNEAVVSRVTGAHRFRGLNRRHGQFVLTRLDPGTYTVVFASMYDRTYSLGISLDQQRGYNAPLQGAFPRSLPVTFVRRVVVKAGQVVDLGNVTVGTDTTHGGGGGSPTTPPTSTTPPPPSTGPVKATVTFDWKAIPRAQMYRLIVWREERGSFVKRLDRTLTDRSVTFETTTVEHALQLHVQIDRRWYLVIARRGPVQGTTTYTIYE